MLRKAGGADRFVLDGLTPGRHDLTAESDPDELREQPFDGSAALMAHQAQYPPAQVEVRAGEVATAELRPSALDPLLLRGRVRVETAPPAPH